MIQPLLERIGRRFLSSRLVHERVFTRIYHSNTWGNPESLSGPGSTRQRGASFTPDVIALLRALDAHVLLDAPCGDFNWIEEVADSIDEYVGIDIVRDLIARNVALYQRPRRRFIRGDLTRDPLPRADVVLCRDCLVHFSDIDAWAALSNIRRSGSRFLLTTTFVDRAQNPPIRTGDWRPLNLQAAPFFFGTPFALVDERCLHSEGIYSDKRLALWELASIPAQPPIP